MASQIFYGSDSCFRRAQDIVTRFFNAKVRLWQKPLIPDYQTKKSDLVLYEADYSGYTPGGLVIPGWTAPVAAVSNGFIVTSIPVQFVVGSPVVGTALVGGFWVELASGELEIIAEFPQPVPMQRTGQGFPVLLSLAASSG